MKWEPRFRAGTPAGVMLGVKVDCLTAADAHIHGLQMCAGILEQKRALQTTLSTFTHI